MGYDPNKIVTTQRTGKGVKFCTALSIVGISVGMTLCLMGATPPVDEFVIGIGILMIFLACLIGIIASFIGWWRYG